MAYDDGSILNFRNFEDFITLLEQALGAPNFLTLNNINSLAQALHGIIAGRQQAQAVDIRELADGLRQAGLGSVPFDVVMHVADAVAKVRPHEDVLQHITLRDLEVLARRDPRSR
jgi:hypothetical protein